MNGNTDGDISMATTPTPPGTTMFCTRDRLAIINVLNSYGYFLDEEKMDDFFGLFTDAPVIEGWRGSDLLVAGWAKFREVTLNRRDHFRQNRIQRRHILSAPRFDRQSGEAATGQLYFQLYKSFEQTTTTLVTIGYYEFTAVKIAADWKIDRLVVRADSLFD